jgi:hypothetical protein
VDELRRLLPFSAIIVLVTEEKKGLIMKKMKLVQALFGVCALALAIHQSADAASCLAPQAPWATGTSACGKVDSIGYGSTTTAMLCITLFDHDLDYADAFGYSQWGLRKVACNPQAGNGLLHACDDAGCSGSVTIDAYAAW